MVLIGSIVTAGALSAPAQMLLDPTFSGDGKLTDWLSRGDDAAYGSAVQPDGKMVVAGSSWTGSNFDFSVVRLNSDGSLDTTFGNGGKVTTDFASNTDQALSVAIQPDGKVVVAGSSYDHFSGSFGFALVRYNPDGSLDTTFDLDGKVITTFGSYDIAYSVAIQPDGKLVAAGGSYSNGGTGWGWDFAVARYNTNGSLDTTFDLDGKVTTAFVGGEDRAYSVAIQADGKIVAGGESYSPSTFRNNLTLVRYSLDGSLDPSFDGDGKVTTQAGSGGSRASAVAIQPDGKIVAAGTDTSGAGYSNFLLVRYNTSGSPEFFGATNSTMPGFLQTNAAAKAVAIQPDGKIVAAGIAGSAFAVIRFTSNFLFDPTFGTGGTVITPSNSYWGANSVALLPDGRIAVVGGQEDFMVMRYDANGSLDTAFGAAGKVTIDLGFFQGNAFRAAAVQADGKIVAAGDVSADFAVARYHPDGSPDTTFGSATGKVRTDMGSSGDSARAVVIQPDGKILVAGGSYDWDDNQCCFALARYKLDGSLDETFGSAGKVITSDNGSYGEGAFAVSLQSDGKIVAAGQSNGRFAVYRYSANGLLDTSFDGDGTVITPITPTASSTATSVTIQSDGKIVVGGYSVSGPDFAVARYNTNGSLDTSFDSDGIVVTDMGSDDYAQDVAIQPDGKIVVGGCTSSLNYFQCDQFALARYNSNGSLDPTFDLDGKATTAFSVNNYRDAQLYSVTIRPDGTIVAGGFTHNGLNNDFTLVHYNANGSLATFGGVDGISTADFDNSSDLAYGMAFDNEARAVVVGESNGRFAIARFTSEGTGTISGRVTTPNGQAMANLRVLLTDAAGHARTATTSSFGLFSFGNVPVGAAYVISATSRRYRFQPRTVNVSGALTNVDFTGLE